MRLLELSTCGCCTLTYLHTVLKDVQHAHVSDPALVTRLIVSEVERVLSVSAESVLGRRSWWSPESHQTGAAYVHIF